MKYINLSEPQRKLANDIEDIFMRNRAIQEADFITALAFLLNKHKKKR